MNGVKSVDERISNIKVKEARVQEFGANDIFRMRWSPRAISEELISENDLMILFEAARWAPSSFNGQPWRFVYVMRDSPEWDSFFNLLVDFNKSWAKNASALVLIVSRKNFEYNEEFSKTHSFDTGAAWQNFALQASLNGLVAHAMGGFDHDQAKIVANVSDAFEVEAMVAVGKPGSLDVLSEDLKSAEQISSRKSVKEFVFRGKLN